MRVGSWYRIGFLGLVLPLAVVGKSWADDSVPEVLTLAREYLEASGQFGPEALELIKERLIQEGLEQEGLGQRSQGESQNFWDGLVAELELSRLLESLAPVYADHFSMEELQTMLSFYQSPTGRKLSSLQGTLEGATLAASQAWAEEALGRYLERPENRETESPLFEKTRMKRTVLDIRSVGTAMMSWLVDVIGDDAGKGPGEVEGRPTWQVQGAEGAAEGASYTSLPYDTVREILVPKYISELPRTDGWGSEYQFSLAEDPLADSVMSIRSAGSDGRFQSEPYQGGPFDLKRSEEDIVWVDGYFLQWPEEPKVPEK